MEGTRDRGASCLQQGYCPTIGNIQQGYCPTIGSIIKHGQVLGPHTIGFDFHTNDHNEHFLQSLISKRKARNAVCSDASKLF